MRISQENPLKIKYVLEYETSEIPMNPDWIKKKIENVTNTINNHFKRNKMKGHRIYMRKVYDQTNSEVFFSTEKDDATVFITSRRKEKS